MIQMRFPSLGCPSNHEPTLNKRGTTITTCLDFSVLKVFFQFFLCSQHVPFKFPIAPRFNPICLKVLPFKSPTLLTYIGGPKREEFHLCIESSIWGRFFISTFFFGEWANQIDSLQKKKKKKKSWTYEAPPN